MTKKLVFKFLIPFDFDKFAIKLILFDRSIVFWFEPLIMSFFLQFLSIK